MGIHPTNSPPPSVIRRGYPDYSLAVRAKPIEAGGRGNKFLVPVFKGLIRDSEDAAAISS